MRVLVDTCVLSEVRKTKGDKKVKQSIRLVPENQLFLSVVSIGEIIKGISLLKGGRRKSELQQWVDFLELKYAQSILSIDIEIARIWGALTADLQKQGVSLPISDGLIAATAKRHGLQIMTRNVSDFAQTGVDILNPWQS